MSELDNFFIKIGALTSKSEIHVNTTSLVNASEWCLVTKKMKTKSKKIKNGTSSLKTDD